MWARRTSLRPKGDKLDDAPPTRHGLERPPKTTTQAEIPKLKINYPKGGASALYPAGATRRASAGGHFP